MSENYPQIDTKKTCVFKHIAAIVLYHPSQYEKRGTHTGKYFVVVPTRKIRNINEGSTFITSDES